MLVREGLPEKMTFEQRPEESEGVYHEDLGVRPWDKTLPDELKKTKKQSGWRESKERTAASLVWDRQLNSLAFTQCDTGSHRRNSE